MLNFDVDRKYIENEFQMAVFDKSTGLSSEEVAEKLREMQNGKSERPRQLVCADMYAFILDNAQLEINEHTPFSVKMNIGVVYSNYANADVFDIEISVGTECLVNELDYEYITLDGEKHIVYNAEDGTDGLEDTDFWYE